MNIQRAYDAGKISADTYSAWYKMKRAQKCMDSAWDAWGSCDTGMPGGRGDKLSNLLAKAYKQASAIYASASLTFRELMEQEEME